MVLEGFDGRKRPCVVQDSMLELFGQLPESLEELWASRNHLDKKCLECLGALKRMQEATRGLISGDSLGSS